MSREFDDEKQNVSFKLEFSLLIFYFIWGYIYYIWHYSHCLYLPIGDANNDTTVSIRFGWKLITNNWKPIVDNQNWKFYNRNKSTILYGTKEFLKPWLSFFILSGLTLFEHSHAWNQLQSQGSYVRDWLVQCLYHGYDAEGI